MGYLEHVKPIVKRGRFLQIKATYYNPIKRKAITITMEYSYNLIPMALWGFGKCFKLDVSEEVMPWECPNGGFFMFLAFRFEMGGAWVC